MKIKSAVLATLACIASTFAAAQTVSVNYNHSQDFSQFHTYMWGTDNANQVQNSILAQVAKQNVDTALQGKGLTLATAGQNADLIVTVSGGLKQETSYTAMSMGMGRWGGGMGTITPEQNVVGTMVVDLFIAKDKTIVWRGLAQNTLSNNGGKNQQLVQKAVTKMFQQYPWPPKK